MVSIQFVPTPLASGLGKGYFDIGESGSILSLPSALEKK